MLDRIGAGAIEDLFDQIPTSLRLTTSLDLPDAMAELDLMAHMESLAEANRGAGMLSFLGAGSYDHHASPVVAALIGRGEYLTAYTPYQAEASQGTLQAIFEFQTLVCQLLMLDVANASMYDGASAAAEAALMARRSIKGGKRCRCLVSRGLHPQYRRVIRTYISGVDCGDDFVEVALGPDGAMSLDDLAAKLDDRTAVVIAGYPNYLGVIEDVEAVAKLCERVGAIACSVTAEPMALGVIEAPGVLGAGIAVAEGQALGVPMSFGGPGVGLMACKEQFMRQMPGRLVGETVDTQGRRAFVLTLATREQHIRREKATSNICSNQGLMALAVTINLCLLGRVGFERLAKLCLSKAEHLKAAIAARPGYEIARTGPTFNEFAVRRTGGDVEGLLARLRDRGILGGVALGPDYPELADAFIVAVTERHRREDLDRFAGALD
jgi:glycine dehydrogenase subunit 1